MWLKKIFAKQTKLRKIFDFEILLVPVYANLIEFHQLIFENVEDKMVAVTCCLRPCKPELADSGGTVTTENPKSTRKLVIWLVATSLLITGKRYFDHLLSK